MQLLLPSRICAVFDLRPSRISCNPRPPVQASAKIFFDAQRKHGPARVDCRPDILVAAQKHHFVEDYRRFKTADKLNCGVSAILIVDYEGHVGSFPRDCESADQEKEGRREQHPQRV